jgi:DNA-binding transcriptional MerR regulator
MTNPVFLGIGQVARLLNYSDNYVRQHERQLGLNPTYTASGHRRYLLEQVLEVTRRMEEGRTE